MSSMSLYASGTTTATSGGVVLATTFTPGVYVLDVDCTHCALLGVVTVTFTTSVQPVYFSNVQNGAYTVTDTVTFTQGGQSTQHLFTPPRQVTTVENSPGTTWTLGGGSNASCDWSLYRID